MTVLRRPRNTIITAETCVQDIMDQPTHLPTGSLAVIFSPSMKDPPSEVDQLTARQAEAWRVEGQLRHELFPDTHPRKQEKAARFMVSAIH